MHCEMQMQHAGYVLYRALVFYIYFVFMEEGRGEKIKALEKVYVCTW
jgi:hypothetical protein